MTFTGITDKKNIYPANAISNFFFEMTCVISVIMISERKFSSFLNIKI